MPTPKAVQFLVIDDITAIRDMLKQHLKELGFTKPPHEAGTIAEATKNAEKSLSGEIPKIEFILSDWNLPDDTGLSFLKKIRSIPEFDSVPHVMITTENEITHMLDAVAAGSNNYVVKPWTKEELSEKIDSAWDSLQKLQKKTATRTDIEMPPPPPPQEEAQQDIPDAVHEETETNVESEEVEEPTQTGLKVSRVNIRQTGQTSTNIKTKKKVKKGSKTKKSKEAPKKKSFWQRLFGK